MSLAKAAKSGSSGSGRSSSSKSSSSSNYTTMAYDDADTRSRLLRRLENADSASKQTAMLQQWLDAGTINEGDVIAFSQRIGLK